EHSVDGHRRDRRQDLPVPARQLRVHSLAFVTSPAGAAHARVMCVVATNSSSTTMSCTTTSSGATLAAAKSVATWRAPASRRRGPASPLRLLRRAVRLFLKCSPSGVHQRSTVETDTNGPTRRRRGGPPAVPPA